MQRGSRADGPEKARSWARKWLQNKSLVARTARFRFQLANQDASGSIDRSEISTIFNSLVANSGLQGVVEEPSQEDLKKYLETRADAGKVSFEDWHAFLKKYMASQLEGAHDIEPPRNSKAQRSPSAFESEQRNILSGDPTKARIANKKKAFCVAENQQALISRKGLFTWEFDKTGEEIFSQGPAGLAHILAHNASDASDSQRGYEELTALLKVAGPDDEVTENSVSTASDWAHVYFHLCAFELELDKVDDALYHFSERILPMAEQDNAVTDGPAMLWNLLLTQPELNLDWNKLRAQALRNQAKQGHSAFGELHDLLTFVGSGEPDLLAKAIDEDRANPTPPGKAADLEPTGKETPEQVKELKQRIANEYGRGLLRYMEGDSKTAVLYFSASLPHFPFLGASDAQTELFRKISRKVKSGQGLGLVFKRQKKVRQSLATLHDSLSSTRFQLVNKYLKRWMRRLLSRAKAKKKAGGTSAVQAEQKQDKTSWRSGGWGRA